MAGSNPGHFLFRCRPRLVRNCALERAPITTGVCIAKTELPACLGTTACGYGSLIGARYLTTRSLSSGRASRGPVGVARRSLVRDDGDGAVRLLLPIELRDVRPVAD